MSRPPDNGQASLLSPRRIAIQLLGFIVGIALLIWCIRGAIEQGRSEEGDAWRHLVHADWRLVAAMLACTLVSALINGSTFWITVQPMKRLRFRDLQCLNLVANMLNYAPIRLGAIARIFYHARVDGLGLLQIGGWFAIIGYVLMLGAGSCLLATLLHSNIDWIWLLLVLGQMALGGMFLRFMIGVPLLARHGQGIERIIADHRAVWGAICLRLLDLIAYTARMSLAMIVLGIDLPMSHRIVLAIVALASSLIPFGRLGFRESCVAATAAWLSLGADTSANVNLLALVESAAEALIFIPLGAVGLLWYRRRFKQSAHRTQLAGNTDATRNGC